MSSRAEPMLDAEVVARSRRRLRRAFATSTTSLVARFSGLVSFLVIVALTVPYLGPERYGVWMTVLSIVGLLTLANLGMGNALISLIARADAADDVDDAGRLVSTAVITVSVVALCIGVVALLLFPVMPWTTVFNVPEGVLASDASHAAAAVIAAVLVGIPIGLVAQIRSGYQEGYVTAWWETVGCVFAVAAVALAVALDAGLAVLVAAAAAAPLAAAMMNFILLVYKRPSLRPRLANVERRYVRTLLRTGSLFFVLQAAVIVSYSSDNFVTAQVLGPAAVTHYAIPSRLALAGITLLTVFLSPLWPAYAEALARGEREWALKTLRRSIFIATSVAAAGALVFALVARPFVDLWSRGEVEPSRGLVLGLSCWIVLGSAGAALAMFLNAAHVVGLQVVCSSLMAAANIALSIVLAQRFGVAGVIWGTVIAYSVFVVLPYSVLLPRLVRRV